MGVAKGNPPSDKFYSNYLDHEFVGDAVFELMVQRPARLLARLS